MADGNGSSGMVWSQWSGEETTAAPPSSSRKEGRSNSPWHCDNMVKRCGWLPGFWTNTNFTQLATQRSVSNINWTVYLLSCSGLWFTLDSLEADFSHRLVPHHWYSTRYGSFYVRYEEQLLLEQEDGLDGFSCHEPTCVGLHHVGLDKVSQDYLNPESWWVLMLCFS